MAAAVVGYAQGQAVLLGDDPLDYFIKTSRKVGIGLITAGAIIGTVGWYAKAAATTAMSNEQNVIGNIGAIFSNIKAPTFQPAPSGTAPVLTANPIQDVQNFFGDAWSDVQAAGSDIAQIGAAMGTLGEDLAVGIIDVAKAILAFILHFPDILWNGAVWGVGGAVADILNWLFPYLIVFGMIMVAVSVVASFLRYVWKVAIADGFKASLVKAQVRVGARVESFWDKVFHNYQAPVTVAVAPDPVVPVSETPPGIDAARAAEPQQSEPEPAGGAVTTTALEPAPDTAPVESPGSSVTAPPETPPVVPMNEVAPSGPVSPGEAPPPPQTNGTTAQTEQLLGGVPPPGWTDEQVQSYLKEAPPPEEEEPEPLTGAAVSARAAELLA